eukprot:GHVS01069821.1.p1 GENE.GHVS01069821.1~~GHVS01069821.1.p1  ORF type:complete len:341 (+),score=77.43 GHVS01069821.1:152-1174(+)
MSPPSHLSSSIPDKGSCCRSSLLLVTTILLLMSCAVLSHSNEPDPSTNSFVPRRFRDINSRDKLWHDSSCFTQGLEFVDATTIVESCGGYGRSRLQLLKLSDNNSTEQTDSSGGTTTVVSVATQTDVPRYLFLEGLTVVDNRVFVLTWKSQQILEFSLPDLKHINTYPFPYDGWGLANHRTKRQSPDGAVVGDKPTDMFFATDGSHVIRKFKFVSNDDSQGGGAFTLADSYEVICGDAGPIRNLNELEFVHPHYLFINIWMTGYVVVYDLSTNSCKRLVDVGTNVIGTGAGTGEAVMNGLASFRDWKADGVCDDVECSPVKLFVTGKMWHDMYAVEINQM